MNDRGKPLSPVDMLKAYLLAPIQDERERSTRTACGRRQFWTSFRGAVEPDHERDATFVKAWLRAQYADTIRDRQSRCN